ncbi:MAG: 3-oxo-5-alpha-steroid 4-dehydrogenase [Verrucomicrobiaceae bacterium]|nr:3-oxo-5-alpha-steroid 4-dehydrogenase [Verrucomicrobiaceae bacterium]
MPPEFWPLLGWGALIVVLVFTGTWLLSMKLNNFSFVDIAWSYGLAILTPLYVLGGTGFLPRRILAAVMGMAWSLRLGSYLLARIARHHPHEDVRYQVLRKDWKGHLGRNFFAFFQAQALLVLLLSVPVLLACLNAIPQLSPLEIIGAVVWLLGIGGEALSDAQMAAFKRLPDNHKGKVCQLGLWRYSRHPNYFFESTVWWGFWLFACGSSWGCATVNAPLKNQYFLLRETVIPLTEKCAVENKGDAYREYQRTTSAFVPWSRKP